MQKGLYEERILADGTTNLLKLYFSVSKEEQARRFERRRNDPLRQWKLSEVDLQAQALWDEFTEKKYRLLQKTHSEFPISHEIQTLDGPKGPFFCTADNVTQFTTCL